MKKIIPIALAILMAFTLMSCTNSDETSSPDTSPSETPAQTSPSPADASDEASPSPSDGENTGISADENLTTVDITIPASFLQGQDMSSFDADTYADEQGFNSATLNEDGSVTVTMTKLKYNEFMKELADSYKETFTSLVGAPETAFIKDITYTDNFDQITVDVDREGYEAAMLDMTPVVLGMSAMVYQSFIEMDKHTEIIIRDSDTGETIKTIVYPDAMMS